MILVLCHLDDAVAVWVANGLSARLGVAVEVATADAVLAGSSVSLHMGDAAAGARLRLADGRLLRFDELTGIVNRVGYIPPGVLLNGKPSDRDYAREEMQAFLLGLFAVADCPVVNPPHPRALSGYWPDPIPEAHMAAAAGLPSRARVFAASTAPEPPAASFSTLVFAGRVYGPPLDPDLSAGAVRFSVLVGIPLVSILFAGRDDGSLEYVGADPLADWSRGGRPLLDALASWFATGQKSVS